MMRYALIDIPNWHLEPTDDFVIIRKVRYRRYGLRGVPMRHVDIVIKENLEKPYGFYYLLEISQVRASPNTMQKRFSRH
jgi:hypothetical protein